MKAVITDTGPLYAETDKADRYHAQAQYTDFGFFSRQIKQHLENVRIRKIQVTWLILPSQRDVVLPPFAGKITRQLEKKSYSDYKSQAQRGR